MIMKTCKFSAITTKPQQGHTGFINDGEYSKQQFKHFTYYKYKLFFLYASIGKLME